MLESILSGIIVLIWGTTEYRMRKLREDVSNKISREETTELIDIKNEASRVRHQELKEDMKEVKEKIDKLIDLQLQR